MNNKIKTLITNQLRLFLFAKNNFINSAICYCYYLLSSHSQSLSRLVLNTMKFLTTIFSASQLIYSRDSIYSIKFSTSWSSSKSHFVFFHSYNFFVKKSKTWISWTTKTIYISSMTVMSEYYIKAYIEISSIEKTSISLFSNDDWLSRRILYIRSRTSDVHLNKNHETASHSLWLRSRFESCLWWQLESLTCMKLIMSEITCIRISRSRWSMKRELISLVEREHHRLMSSRVELLLESYANDKIIRSLRRSRISSLLFIKLHQRAVYY